MWGVKLMAKLKNGKKQGFFQEIRRKWLVYLLALPGLLAVFIFSYLPLCGLVIAFQNYIPHKGIFGSEFVGLDNISFFISTGAWKMITVNTLWLNTLFIITGTVFSIALAIMITELGNKWFKKISQSIMILPNFLSWAVVAVMSTAFLSSETGMFPKLLENIGVANPNFYTNPDLWPPFLVFLRIWKGAGFGSIIYIAAIMGISAEQYESAVLDGATKLQSIIHITIPSIMPTVIIMTLLSVGSIFYGDFGMIFTLVGDNSQLVSTTDVIDTFVYRALRSTGKMGYAASVGLFQSVLGFLIVLISNAIARRVDKDASLF